MPTWLITGSLSGVVLATVLALAFTTSACCSTDPEDDMPCACTANDPNC